MVAISLTCGIRQRYTYDLAERGCGKIYGKKGRYENLPFLLQKYLLFIYFLSLAIAFSAALMSRDLVGAVVSSGCVPTWKAINSKTVTFF